MPFAPLFAFSFFVHGLLAWRLLPDLQAWGSWMQTGFAGWTLASALLVPLGLMRMRSLSPRMAQWLTWLGLLCMGLCSSLFALMVLRELLLALQATLLWLWPTAPMVGDWRAWSALAVPLLAMVMSVIGWVNARRTAPVVPVDVPVAKLPQALEGLRIVQISDIHVGPTIKAGYLERIVKRVNSLNADLVAITGDLVDGPVHAIGSWVDSLQQLQSTHGTFFVTGNHEYYSGAQAWIDKLQSLGITVLMNEHVVVQHLPLDRALPAASLVVAGVSDYSAHHFDSSHQSDPHKALQGAPQGFKLLLAHQPRSAPAAAQAGFDLQLSGHTHGGQFWPWGHFVRYQQPFTAGLHRLQQLWVYTSRGTGYWGPPKRFAAPSEITQLRLVRAGTA